MKPIHLIIGVCVFVFLAFTSCSNKNKTQTMAENKNDNVLVIYYSQKGATRTVAEELQRQLGADIMEIEASTPYDGDYEATISRWMSETENNARVEINPVDINLEDYSTIFIGAPIWGGKFASPMQTFLIDSDLGGKKIVTFATFGSGGINTATVDLASKQPNATVSEGYGVRNARLDKAPEEIKRFLIEGGYVEGEIAPLPPYSNLQPVNDEEAAVFHAACDSYTFPLGKPIAVAKRKTPTSVDYKFNVESTSPNGEKANAVIYVTVPDSVGSVPEFTQVVR